MKTTSEESTLYPKLTAQGEEEAQRIMDSFKPKIKKVIEEVMSDLYTDVSYYVQSDHWENYRNDLMNGLKSYGTGKKDDEFLWKQVRQAIYFNHKDEITKDLNQDLLEENKQLLDKITQLENLRARL